jgi:hypothetical protein
MTSSIATTSCGELPQVTCGFSVVQSISITRSYPAADSSYNVRHAATAWSHSAPFGAIGRP